MKKLMIISALLALVGCASNGDVENIQTQLDGLKVSVNQVNSDVAFANEAAASANKSASEALKAAEQAAALAADANLKLDAIFTHTMMK